MKRGVANQLISAQLLSKTDGSDVVTGETTVYLKKDSTETGSIGTATYSATSKCWFIDTGVAGNTDGACLVFTWINSAACTVTQVVYPAYPQTGDAFARLGAPAGASIAADLLTAMGYIDTEIQSIIDAIGNGTYGLPALNTDMDALLARLTELRAGYLDNLSAGAVAIESNIQTHAAAALTAYDPPTRAEATSDKAEVLAAVDTPLQADDVRLANLDAAISTRSTYSGGPVESVTAPVTVSPAQLTAGVYKTNITLTADPVEIRRGDTGEAATLSFVLGTSWNLTGKKVYFIAKANKSASNSRAIVNRECTVTDAVNGGATITLTSAETATVGNYYAEIEIRTDDDAATAQTARQFRLAIVQDVRL